MPERERVKLYFDYKSPFAYLAMAPALALPSRFAIELRWIPYQLRIKGKGERSVYSEWKVRYSYLDARRAANQRGGFPIRGPRKVYDSTPALIGGLFAQRTGFFPLAAPATGRFSSNRWTPSNTGRPRRRFSPVPASPSTARSSRFPAGRTRGAP